MMLAVQSARSLRPYDHLRSDLENQSSCMFDMKHYSCEQVIETLLYVMTCWCHNFVIVSVTLPYWYNKCNM